MSFAFRSPRGSTQRNNNDVLLRDFSPRMSFSPPKTQSYLLQRRKCSQNLGSNFVQINRENRLLEKRMEGIFSGKNGKGLNTFNERYYEPRINHKYEARQRQYAKTHAENVLLEKRLWTTKPYYRSEEWEKDFERHQRFIRLHALTSNYGYAQSPRTKRRSESHDNKRSVRKQQYLKEEEEEDDDDDNEEEEKVKVRA